MVRGADHSGGVGVGVALSSIALLQERFRQLQKMKELRQEKELLRMMLSESERYSPPITLTPHDHQFPSNYTFSAGSESMMFLPPKPHCQLSLSLWPDSQTTKHPDSRGIVEVSQSNRVNSSLVSTASSMKLENSGSDHDIDTSLHL